MGKGLLGGSHMKAFGGSFGCTGICREDALARVSRLRSSSVEPARRRWNGCSVSLGVDRGAEKAEGDPPMRSWRIKY